MRIKKRVKFITGIIAFALACILAFNGTYSQNGNRVVVAMADGTSYTLPVSETGLVTAGQSSVELYVSDVKLSSKKTKAEAEKELQDAGYIVKEGNLNKGGRGYICLGYKLTTKKEDAITGIKATKMNSGYTEWDYREFLKDNAEGLPEIVLGMKSACQTMKKLLNEGNVAAQTAYKTLNILCVPNNAKGRTGTPLGDYLLSSERTDEDYETLILILQSNTLSFINNQLAVGCSNCYVNGKLGENTNGWVSDPTFLSNLVHTLENSVASLNNSSDFETKKTELISKYANDIDSLTYKSNFEDVIDDSSRQLLAGTKVDIQIDNVKCTNLYEVVTSSSRLIKACFIDSLPNTVSASGFGGFIKVHASDTTRLIPGEVPNLPEIVSPWMANTVEYLNKLREDPFEETGREIILDRHKDLGEEPSFFVEIVKNYIGTYLEKKTEYADLLKEIGTDLSMKDMIVELSKRVAKQNEGVEDGNELTSDAFLHFASFEVLRQYKFIDKTNFLGLDENGNDIKVNNLAELLLLIYDQSFESEEIANTLACTFLSGMSKADLYLMKTAGLALYTMNCSISPEDGENMEKQYLESKDVLVKAYASIGCAENECSIWVGTNKDLLETSYLCMTSETERVQKANQEFSDSLMKAQEDKLYKQHISDAMEYAGIAAAVAGVVFSVCEVWLAVSVGTYLGLGAILKLGLFAISGCLSTFGVGTTITALAIAGLVSFIGMIVLLVCIIVFLIFMFLPDPKPKEEIERTPIPLIMMDCEENINGKIKTAIRYDVVTDINGDPVDLNNEEGDYWNVLYYTKTTEIGSPLMQNDDEECFAITDYMEGPNKSMPVQTFGYTPAFSLNSGRSEDGVYLHYYTYNSINGIQDEKQEMGKYVETIVMATAKRRVLAQNSILRKSHNYSLIDCNLTPNTDYYTYLGFSTTDDAKKAITDIRVAPSTDAYTFTWGGGNNYIAIYGSDEISNPIKTAGDTMIAEGDPSPFTFQIYVSYSESVGDPILSSSLRIVENINDVPDGYEYTRWFSGAAFDFAMQSDLDDIMDSKRILCYAPEESLRHYNNEPEYLAGFSFFSGFEAWDYVVYRAFKVTTVYKWHLKDWISELGCKCFASDLTPNAMNDNDDKTYIAYSTTHNPKKAITDIGVFTGEPKSPLLADNITRSGVGFESCTVFYQSDKGYVGKGGKKKVRDIRDSHAYITNLEKEADMCCNGEWDGYSVKARAMYVAGPTEGVDPILLSEVVYSLTKSDVPTAKGSNRKIYNLSTGRAFGKKAGTGWKTVHALEQFYYDEYDVDDNLTVGGTNIGLSIDEKNGQGCCLYIYYKNGTANITRGKYLKNIEIVGSIDEKSSYDMARYKAMSMGEDIINLSAPLFNLPQNRYDASNETIAYKSGTQNSYPDSAVYLVASYQEDVKGAIGAVKIAYQDGQTLLPATMSAIIDYTGKSVSFTKGNSVAPRIKDAGSDKIPEGYVLYKTSSGEAIGRIGVQEDGRTGYDGTGHYFTYLSDQSGKIFAANGGYEQMVLLYSAVEPKYISSIMISEEGYFPKMQLELNQLGYHQFICTDIMAGNCLKRYHIAIARTANPMEAIKDILIVDHDMGKETTINDRVYTRVNDTNLINGYTYTGQVFIYTTKGNELERGEEGDYQYAERVAITNIGLRYKLGKLGDTVETYWNGSNLDTIANVTPSSITDSTRILIVPGMDKDGDFTKNGILNGNTYQESRLIFGMDPAWTEVHGESYLVFTTNSGYSMLDYEEGYKEDIFTGTKTGDEKLGLATVVSDNSLIVSIVVVLVGASVVAAILIFGKKKGSTSNPNDDADE